MTETVIEQRDKLWSLIGRYFIERPLRVKEENQHYFVILSVMTVFGFSVHFLYLFLFWFLGVKPLALFNILSVPAWLVAVILNRSGYHATSILIGVFEVYAYQTIAVINIGWASGFQYYILILPIAIYLTFYGFNLVKFALIILCFLNYSFLDYFYRVAEPLFVLNPLVLDVLYYVNILFVILIMSVACHFFNNKIYAAEAALRKEQEKVEKTYSLLSKYVPPQLADTISDGQIDLIWQHNRKKLSMFFSDIKDFTAITESMEPEDMAGMLNEYITEMNAIVNKYRGTLAQVIGDALYVFFGAPQSSTDKDDAVRCVKMAMEMQQKMKVLNDRWFDRGVDEIFQIRCGINTGMSTVGGYGS